MLVICYFYLIRSLTTKETDNRALHELLDDQDMTGNVSHVHLRNVTLFEDLILVQDER